MSKKKKVIILVSMVLLLVATTTLNIVLSLTNKGDDPVNGGSVSTGNFYTDYRADRQSTRDQTMLYLDSILNNETLSASAKDQATAQKLELTKIMETETILEGVLKANGYDDAVVSVSSDSQNVYVFVKAESLTDEQYQTVYDLILGERKDIDPMAIRVTPVA